MINMQQKISLLLILSANKSGSTLLDFSLNNHADIISGGEFVLTNKICSCQNKISECNFWKNIIDEHLVQNIKSEDEMHNYNFKVYRKMKEVHKPKFILDSSKNINKAKKLINNQDFDVKIIFLSRNPINVAASNKRKFLNDGQKSRLPLKNIYYQLKIYINIFLLRKNIISIIKYEDFVKDPLLKINKIFSKLDLKPITNIILKDKNFHNLGGDSSFTEPNKKNDISKISNKNTNIHYLSTRDKLFCYLCFLPIFIFRFFIRN